MSILSLRLPDSLHEQVRKLAKRDGISINQFIATAVAEKMSVQLTVEYLEKRSAKGNKAKFNAALDQIPDIEPEEFDRL